MWWDEYSWDALDWLESRCMDNADVEDKQCYPKGEEDAVPDSYSNDFGSR